MRPRDVLFRTYGRTHLSELDGDRADKVSWFRSYIRAVYMPHFGSLDRGRTKILDLGCSSGYLLEALGEEGFDDLHGIDLSPEDVQEASDRLPRAQVECGDAQQYLLTRLGSFDVIVTKAVLEHVEKEDCLEFLRAIRGALRHGGVALLDVPNMDWLFATHERYMDFTHEVGFTRESLSQVVRNAFDHVEVIPVLFSAMRSHTGRFKKVVARNVLTILLTWAEPEIERNPIWARNLLAIARI